jgi:putative peptide zinc metalloprotease protein
LAVIVMNLNPLLKLDGYYFLTELIGIPDLKERSTSFVSAWFQRTILRLPAEVPAVPRRRVLLFIVYAVISGAYSYLVLFVVVRFSYNMGYKLFAEFALIPAGALAFAIFRGRLKSLATVMKQIRQIHLSGGFWTRPKTIGIAVAIAFGLGLPVLRDRENAYYVVEPTDPILLHSTFNGRVDEVYVHEGEEVRKGQALLRMSSSDVAGMGSSAEAEMDSAHYQAVEAQLGGRSIGATAADERAAARSGSLATEAEASLTLRTSTDGQVVTTHPGELVNQLVASGEPLLSIAGGSSGRPNETLRLYIPEGEVNRIHPGDEVAIAPPGYFSILRLKLSPLQGEATTLPAGLVAHQDYKGIVLPTFYCAQLALGQDEPQLPLGTAGSAQVFGARRSLAAVAWQVVVDVVHAHVW